MAADSQTSGSGLTIELRTPEGPVYSGTAAKAVSVPGTKAPMGILPRHAPLMSSLTVGLTRIVDTVGSEWRFVTGEGFVEVHDNRVLLLVDTAEDVSEIDVGRAQAAASRARDRLASPGGAVDRTRASAALQRARARLSAAGR